MCRKGFRGANNWYKRLQVIIIIIHFIYLYCAFQGNQGHLAKRYKQNKMECLSVRMQGISASNEQTCVWRLHAHREIQWQRMKLRWTLYWLSSTERDVDSVWPRTSNLRIATAERMRTKDFRSYIYLNRSAIADDRFSSVKKRGIIWCVSVGNVPKVRITTVYCWTNKGLSYLILSKDMVLKYDFCHVKVTWQHLSKHLNVSDI